MIRILDIIRDAKETAMEISPGLWVPTRGVNHTVEPFLGRLKDAWLVLTRKADAVIWPEDDPDFVKREMALRELLEKRKLDQPELFDEHIPETGLVSQKDKEMCNQVRFILNKNMHNKTILKAVLSAGGIHYEGDTGITSDLRLELALGLDVNEDQRRARRSDRILTLIREAKQLMKLKTIREYLLISPGAIGRIIKKMVLDGLLYKADGVGNKYGAPDVNIGPVDGHALVKFHPQHSDALQYVDHLIAASKNLLPSPHHSGSKHWPVKIITADVPRKVPDANAINHDPASTGVIEGVRAECLATGVQSEFVGGRHIDSCKRAMKWLASDISAIVGIKVWCAVSKQENYPTSQSDDGTTSPTPRADAV